MGENKMNEQSDIGTAIILVLLAALFLLLSSCSYINSSPIVLQTYSDQGVLDYSKALKERWGSRSTKAQLADIGGTTVLAGLSTAVAGANEMGATGGMMAFMVTAGNFVGQLLGIIDASDRMNALNFGSNAVRKAEGEYAGCLTRANKKAPPTDELTKCGASLLTKVNSAISAVDSLIAKLMPDADDIENLKPKPTDKPPSP